MKHNILYIFFTLLAWTVSLQVGAQTTSYVLDDAKERSWSTINNSGNYNLSGPGATLTFEAKRQFAGVNYFYVAWSTDNGSTWTENSLDLTTSYQSYTYELSPDVTTVRFLSKTGATLSKYVRNVKVTRATTLSSATSSIDFGKTNPNVGTSRTISVAYNNTTYPAQLTGTSSNPNFTVTPKSMGEYGAEEVTVNYTPQTVGVHTGTVTLNMAGKNYSFNVAGTSVLNYQISATAQINDPTFGQATVEVNNQQASNGQGVTYSEESSETSVSTSATFTAVPAKGHKFVGWYSDANYENLVSSNAEYQTTLTASTSNITPAFTLYAKFEELYGIVLNATTVSNYTPDTYEYVIVERPIKVGYNSIALPLAIADVSEIGAEWAAQLSLVTYNAHDGYSVYFEKVTAMEANHPYILFATEASEEMEFHNITIEAAESMTCMAKGGVDRNDASYTKWQMVSNFTPSMDMEGKYGVVNADGILKIGGAGSTLGAFSAYLVNLNDWTLPSDTNDQTGQQFSNHRARIATHFLTGEELLTVIDRVQAEAVNGGEGVSVLYDLSGRLTTSRHSGAAVERRADGTTRKVLLR